MTQEPTACPFVRAGLAVILDAVGVVLLVWLGWRMFFVFDDALQTPALAVGLLGTAACWADRDAHRTVSSFMLAYVGIALLSAAVHRWTTVTSLPEPDWLTLFTPATHLVVMAVFVFGAAHLLRTPRRLSLLALLLVMAVGVLAVQILLDRAIADFIIIRSGAAALPSVPQWGGIHGTSLLLTIALPLALSVSVVNQSGLRMPAGIVLGGGFLLVAYFNGSRGGLVSMVLVCVAMAVLRLGISVRRRWSMLALWAVVLAPPTALTFALLSSRTAIGGIKDLSGRGMIWEATGRLALDNPWLGVGPGNYSQAILESGHAKDFIAQYGGLHNAHSLLLHVGAEVGVFGVLCLLAFVGWALRSCWRALARGCLPMIAVGLLFALAGFMVHSVSENFLDARADVERTRLVVWIVFASVLALERLSRQAPAVEG